MKEKYTIGETASLLGVSVQTLRYYDKIGLLSPKYIDENNSYRYYCYEQFHYLDKIKYLQSFGLSLNDIKDIISNGSVKELLNYLNKQKEDVDKEIDELVAKKNNIDWYIEYFNYFDKNKVQEKVYKLSFPERYIIKSPCYYKEPLSHMEIRLAKLRSEESYKGLNYRRQFGYKLSFESFMENEFYPKEYFVFLSKKPNLPKDMYWTIPKGEYLCTRIQLLKNSWDSSILSEYFTSSHDNLAIALEFEDNLDNWDDAFYEIQILI